MECSVRAWTAFLSSAPTVLYRGISLVRNRRPLGPYSRTIYSLGHMVVLGGVPVSYEQSIPVVLAPPGSVIAESRWSLKVIILPLPRLVNRLCLQVRAVPDDVLFRADGGHVYGPRDCLRERGIPRCIPQSHDLLCRNPKPEI